MVLRVGFPFWREGAVEGFAADVGGDDGEAAVGLGYGAEGQQEGCAVTC